MQELAYFGHYYRFNTTNKRAAPLLLGSDCIIGKDCVLEYDQDKQMYWICNDYSNQLGYLSYENSHELRLAYAEGYRIRCFVTKIAFTESPEGGYYWGELACLGYQAHDEEDIGPFIQRLQKAFAQGVCPDLDLSSEARRQAFDPKTDYLPTKRHHTELPQEKTAILKDQVSFKDRLVEQGRAGNKGCYIASWIFLLSLATGALVWISHLL